jgi:polyhydroxyalkanoate synthesis regulator phasin
MQKASWCQAPTGNDISDDRDNTGGGTYALHSNTTGSYNTGYGGNALYFNSTGNNNTATGFAALSFNTTGSSNTAYGTDALYSNSIGIYNTGIGVGALVVNQSGDRHTAVGYYALSHNDYGHNNTALGYQALFNNTGGTRNLGLGFLAGYYQTTGSNNIYLASYGVAGETNTMRLGQDSASDSGVTKHSFIAGVFGVPVSGSQVLINSKGQLGVLASSARYKRDIQDMGKRTQGLLKLRPVTFRYKQDPEAVLQYGLIAEEVAKVYPELVVRGANGEVESVQYHQIISMLLNEVQHQQKQIEELKTAHGQELAEVKVQNEELRSHNTALERRLDRLEAQAAHIGMLATRYEKRF